MKRNRGQVFSQPGLRHVFDLFELSQGMTFEMFVGQVENLPHDTSARVIEISYSPQ